MEGKGEREMSRLPPWTAKGDKKTKKEETPERKKGSGNK